MRDQERLRRSRRALFWGTPIVGVLLMPLLGDLEQSFGLKALFTARGEVAPAADVIVVAIDENSVEQVDRPEGRLAHAGVVDTLTRAGASLIVLDLFLHQESDHDDRLAQSFREAGNVIVAAHLDRDSQPAFDRQILRKPAPVLASAALGVAPWLLPEEFRVDWVFARNDSGQYTVPFVAIQARYYEEFVAVLERVWPDVAAGVEFPVELSGMPVTALDRVMESFHELFVRNPDLADAALEEIGNGRPALKTLVEMYALRSSFLDNRIFLNFYGRPRTVATIAYDDVLAGSFPAPGQSLENVVVFVGYSALAQPNQDDAKPYVYTRDGFRLSGVEFGATTYLNVVEGSLLTRPPVAIRIGILAAWGLLVAFLLNRYQLWSGFALLAVFAAAFGGIALALFADSLWLPLVVPGVQAMYGLAASLRVKQLSDRASLAVSTAEEAALALTGRGRPFKVDNRVILFADEQDSKKWLINAERNLDVHALRSLREDFAHRRDSAIAGNGGHLNHTLADSMLAYWMIPESGDGGSRQAMAAACRAAIQVQAGIDDFNTLHSEHPLHLRIGLHTGRIMSGLNPSTLIRDWRMEGQAIHAAERLESLNKILGTRIVVSGEIAQCLDADEFWAPALGTFIFCDDRGDVIVNPLAVHLLKPPGAVSDDERRQLGLLARAREAIGNGDWPTALDKLAACDERVTWATLLAAYIRFCRESADETASTWRGTIAVAASDKGQRFERYPG